MRKRRVCFVTGTRAEFGLMQTALCAINNHPELTLQIVVTGMHLDTRRSRFSGGRLNGWKVDRVVPWARTDTPASRATATGKAIAALTRTFEQLRADVVLVVGDRVEALAAATAGHLCDRVVVHVHGGDRAQGQSDDALRHAITKLAHVHLPATRDSARRIVRMGEDRRRVRVVGAPGIDGIRASAAGRARVRRLVPHPFALILLHPTSPDAGVERRRAEMLRRQTLAAGATSVAIVHPNNDPGSRGIVECWRAMRDPRVRVFVDLARGEFLGMLRDAAVLVGNSSAGIIEAGTFGTPVVDIGPRQSGRLRGGNVRHVEWDADRIRAAIARAWRTRGSPRRPSGPYATGGAGRRIAQAIASLQIDERLLRKVITY